MTMHDFFQSLVLYNVFFYLPSDLVTSFITLSPTCTVMSTDILSSGQLAPSMTLLHKSIKPVGILSLEFLSGKKTLHVFYYSFFKYACTYNIN